MSCGFKNLLCILTKRFLQFAVLFKLFEVILHFLVNAVAYHKQSGELFVYGSLNKTITAKEVRTMVKFLKKVHPKNKVLVIDAAIGAREDVGKIKITDAPIKPGLGADKDLSPIGDASIICVISEKSKNNLAFTTFTRLSPVFLTAKIIADAVSFYIESTKDPVEVLPPIAYGV